MGLKELKVTFEELFDILELDKKDYENSQLISENIYVNSPQGFKGINGAVVKKDCKMFEIKFSNNSKCRVADTHIFSVGGNEVFAENLGIGDFVDSADGNVYILEKNDIGLCDGYDINIDFPHWYYNPYGVIYHNTLFKTDIISGMIKQGKKVLLISMEMSDKEIMKRVHANALDLPINYLTDLNKTENQLNALKAERPDMRTISKDEILKKYNDLKMSGTLGKLYIKDYPNGTFTASMLDGLLETYKNELDLDFDIVFLDYLGIMKSDLISPNAGLYSYVKSIVEEVRAIAKKHQIPIVSSSQLNRSAVNNTDASNDSVSDSIGTVQTADFMVFLLQTEQMKTENRILCKVTKNRFNGRTDTWEMQVDYQHMRFSDCVDTMSNAQIAEAVGLIGDDMKANIEIIKKENSKNNIEESWDSLKVSETSKKETINSDEDIMKLLGL